MDSYFSRVKSIINRLREVLKCQKCIQMKEENSMLFYHVCDHFYCVDCLEDTNKACPLCKHPLDKPMLVVNDKNILSLYHSLSKFELPSKQDVEKVYRSHKESKQEALNESFKQVVNQQDQIQETPKNQGKNRPNLREKENRKRTSLTSIEGTGTITVSSGEGESSSTPKSGNFAPGTTSTQGRAKKNGTPARWRNKATTSTPASTGRTVTPQRSSRRRNASLIPCTGSSKGNMSFTKSNINKRNSKGETQLHLACKKSNFTEMTKLITAGANINAQDNAGWTPLHDSVFSGNVEVMKFLLDHGAKVNAPGLENTTALHEAIAIGNAAIVKLLLDYGADVNSMNIYKERPLDLVNKYKLDEMKQILLEASPNTKSSEAVPAQEDDEELLLLYKYNLTIEDEKAVNKFVETFKGEIISSLTWKTPPSHIIIPDVKIQLTWALISSAPRGCRVVTARWVKDSLEKNVLKPAADYEPSSALFSGFTKARMNKQNQLPGLFTGCHFFFGGNLDQYTVKNLTIGKEDLKILVKKNGGVIVKRCPDPESLALEKTVPFHALPTSSLQETAYFIIYQTEKWDPKPKYNMSHMKTLPVEWLVCCILKFELIEPNDRELWSNFL